MSSPSTSQKSSQKLGFFQVLLSVFAAMFGVRSNKNRERDFQQGKFIHFVVAGVIALALFIFFIVLLVKFALRMAGV